MTRSYLSRRERQFYDVLRAADGAVVSHDQIIAAMYGSNALPGDRMALKVYALALRRKGYAIRNVWGVGYALGAVGRCPMCGGEMSD
jgi:DNA-binding response OmpR family regulator